MAKATCNSHYTISAEKKVQNIINSDKMDFKQKTKKIHQTVIETLKKRKISYHSQIISDAEIISIKPSKTSKLGRFARYLENNYQAELAFSFSLTGKIDAGLDMSDEGILLTSIQDILRGEIGAGTRHELSHLWELTMSELGTPHPVFNTTIRSESAMFNSKYMNGYEHFISYGEIHAYARELHYSLWKLRHTKNAEMKKMVTLDILEAQNRLSEITTQLLIKTKQIHKKLRKYKVSQDDYTFFIKGEGLNITVEKQQTRLKNQLLEIIDHLNDFKQKLNLTANDNLEVMLKEYLTSLK